LGNLRSFVHGHVVPKF
jgi:hypothetical protein